MLPCGAWRFADPTTPPHHHPGAACPASPDAPAPVLPSRRRSGDRPYGRVGTKRDLCAVQSQVSRRRRPTALVAGCEHELVDIPSKSEELAAARTHYFNDVAIRQPGALRDPATERARLRQKIRLRWTRRNLRSVQHSHPRAGCSCTPIAQSQPTTGKPTRRDARYPVVGLSTWLQIGSLHSYFTRT